MGAHKELLAFFCVSFSECFALKLFTLVSGCLRQIAFAAVTNAHFPTSLQTMSFFGGAGSLLIWFCFQVIEFQVLIKQCGLT